MAGVAKYQISWFSPNTRATAMAIMMGGTRFGRIAATALFAPIIQHTSWQAGFACAGITGIVVAAFFYGFAKEKGAAATRISKHISPEERAARRRGLRELVLNRSFVIGTLACFLNLGAGQGFTTYLMVFLTRTRGFSLIEAGAIIGGTTAIGIVSGPVSGMVADLLKSKKKVCLAGAIATVILTALIIVADSAFFLIVILSLRVLLQSLPGTPLNSLQAQAAAGPYVGRAAGWPDAPEDLVRRAARDTIDRFAPGGGFMFRGSACGPKGDIQLENKRKWMTSEYEKHRATPCT
jgi:predicted MFS family arabinose efflux permease